MDSVNGETKEEMQTDENDQTQTLNPSTRHTANRRSAGPRVSRLPTADLIGGSIKLLATRVRRLQSELKEMTETPPDNCSASPKDDSLDEWIGTLAGPEGTVYEGGIFFLDISFPDAYPFEPVKVRFLTRIYHCNINSQGLICLDALKEAWSPALTLAQVLLCITSLLWECNANDPLVGAIGNLYLTDREEHDRIARLWTQKYAC